MKEKAPEYAEKIGFRQFLGILYDGEPVDRTIVKTVKKLSTKAKNFTQTLRKR